jgi:serine/threonine protein kinase/Tol biopolymer transport system component
MSIATGARVGPYEIESAIGAGGMGEVYRARDTKLGRTVAIKVLPDALAADPDRVARFEREAKVLASLNHAHIATIYGVEDAVVAGHQLHALVMELVEGQTLADRIAQGPVPVDEALPIGRQIAEALEAAHELGIIHRDLKPANIKLRSDGTVKVLDFGLAKALDPSSSALADAMASPTITSPAMMTGVGVLIGTAAYMAPEQARGRPTDKRSDIWAFGCVLYEMLAGKRAFDGEDTTEIVAAVVKTEPDWTLLPQQTPPPITTLLRRCLRKDRRQRLQDIADARIEIEEARSAPVDERGPIPISPSYTWRRNAAWAAVFLAVIGVTGFATWTWKPTSPIPRVVRTVITLPAGDQLGGLGAWDLPAVAISPDGTKLAYVASRNDTRQIYVRPLDAFESKPILGTEGGLSPFFSPDGQWIGFLAGGSLKKVLVTGGGALTVVNTGSVRGASWGASGIVLAPTTAGPLQLASASGGVPKLLTRLEPGESTHRFPQFLSDPEAVLFAAGAGTVTLRVAVHSLGTGQRKTLAAAGTSPRYVPPGYLVYAQAGSLMAVPFDAKRLEVTGTPVPVVEGVLQSLANGFAQYDVSIDGVLVYVSGGVQGINRKMVWVDRNGTEQPTDAPARAYRYPRLSPDGSRVAATIEEGESHVWVYDTGRDALTRLTFEGGVNLIGTWTPDGKRVAYASTRTTSQNPFWQAVDGSGSPEQLIKADIVTSPTSFSPDTKVMAYVDIGPDTGYDIGVMRLDDRKPQPFLRTRFFEGGATFSPDGHWLAYTSDEAGRPEIFVQPYPGPGGKWQVSTDGGTEPVWNRNGRELFYRSGNKMIAVHVTTGATFSAGKPRTLFEAEYVASPASLPNYDVSADGQRFLMLKPGDQAQPATQINVVTNWVEELKRRVPVK